MNKIVVVNNQSGVSKEIKIGYSWTMLFFGIFTPLIRGDWKTFVVMLIANLVLIALFPYGGGVLLYQLGTFVYTFFYNKFYARGLYKDGFRGATPKANELLEEYIEKQVMYV